MSIKNKTLSNTYVIAEIGVNHNGDIGLAMQLIDLARENKADAVKLQMYHPKLLCSSIYRSEEMAMLEQYYISIDDIKILKEYTKCQGLDFIITPFDFRSLEEVISIGCEIIKVGSGELTHIPLLKAIALHDVDIILSTGAANLGDVKRAVTAIREINSSPIGLLHCVSTYPAPNECLNLRAITTLKETFKDCVVGYSDHSIGSRAASLAITLGAQIIEKHITLDKNLQGPDHLASADQKDFRQMMETIKATEVMLGDGIKSPQPCEGTIGHSIVAAKDLKKGSILTSKDFAFKRPGSGLRPYYDNYLVGLPLIRDIAMDELIEWKDVIRG